MNVLFIEPAGAGGIAHCTYALANALGARGVECDILTSPRWHPRPLAGPVRIHRVFRGRKTNPAALYLRCFQLRRSVNVVHWQSTTYPKLILLLMRVIPLKKMPWIFTVHNVLPHERTEAAFHVYGKIYERMDGLIFHTQHSLETFKPLFPNVKARTRIIPLGEYGFLHGKTPVPDAQPRDPVVLFFGNVRHYKGLDVLIRAFAEVKKAIPEAVLRAAGQWFVPFQEYEDLINRLGLSSSVEFEKGFIPDEEIPNLFAPAGVIALPYRDIDQSAVLLLAMALGKPIVATRVGGMAEILRDGRTALLVPPEDPAALAEALVRILRDPQGAARLGRNAREDVNTRFSWERIAELTESFYQSVTRP
ncbi:MAG: glycosyltransferase family 4 protein [bacterium]